MNTGISPKKILHFFAITWGEPWVHALCQ